MAILVIGGFETASAWAGQGSISHSARRRVVRVKAKETEEPRTLSKRESEIRDLAYSMAEAVGCRDFKSRAWKVGREIAFKGPGYVSGREFRRYFNEAIEKRLPNASFSTRFGFREDATELAELFSDELYEKWNLRTIADVEDALDALQMLQPYTQESEGSIFKGHIQNRIQNLVRKAAENDLDGCGNVAGTEPSGEVPIAKAEKVEEPKTRIADRKAEKEAPPAAVEPQEPTHDSAIAAVDSPSALTPPASPAPLAATEAEAPTEASKLLPDLLAPIPAPAPLVAANGPVSVLSDSSPTGLAIHDIRPTKKTDPDKGGKFADAQRTPAERRVNPQGAPSVAKKPAAPAPRLNDTVNAQPSSVVGNSSTARAIASVDEYFVKKKMHGKAELTKDRDSEALAPGSTDVDSCISDLRGKDSFGDRIAFFVKEHMPRTTAESGRNMARARIQNDFGKFLGYGKYGRLIRTGHTPTLASHKMCRVSADDLAETLGKKNVPSQATIDRINKFADAYNRAFEENDPAEIAGLYTKLMGCLSYSEGLTTAETEWSRALASLHGLGENTPGRKRPEGVNFSHPMPKGWHPGRPLPRSARDPANVDVGLFQFGATLRDNITPCVTAWNETYPHCRINPKSSDAEMMRIVASPLQTFNAFCGVQKIVQNYFVQVNTADADMVFPKRPENIMSGGLTPTIRESKDRCVSLHMNLSHGYNHFGPLMNKSPEHKLNGEKVGDLGKLMACVSNK